MTESPEVITLEFPADSQWFSTVRLFTAAVARHYRCSEADIDDLKLAISEACNHAVLALKDTSRQGRVAATAGAGRLAFQVQGGGHPGLVASGAAGDKYPDSQELAEMLGSELIRALFSQARTSPGPAGLDLEISVPIPV